MYKSGNMILTFKNKKQAEDIFPFIKEFLNDNDECEECSTALELDGKEVKVDGDLYIPTYVYEDLVRQIPKVFRVYKTKHRIHFGSGVLS
jgi:hypothetical protein